MPSPGHPSQPYRRKPPAFKHGAYSATALLPGEDQAEYAKLHRKIIAEYAVSGPLEEYIAAELARLIWRSEHLSTFCTADMARQRLTSGTPENYLNKRWEELQAAAYAKAIKAEEEVSREQLGECYDLLALGKVVTVPYLKRELELRQLLSDMIDKCIKRLFQAKGLKSISAVSPSAPVQRLSARAEAA
jgi:hypothetical protein